MIIINSNLIQNLIDIKIYFNFLLLIYKYDILLVLNVINNNITIIIVVNENIGVYQLLCNIYIKLY